MLFLMVKSGLEATGDSRRFAGGSHGFLCMAKTLAAAGHDVHVLTSADKASVMHDALLGGYFSQLRYGSAAGGAAMACWKHEGLSWHVGLRDTNANCSSTSAPVASSAAQLAAAAPMQPTAQMAPHEASLISEASAVARAASNSAASTSTLDISACWVILDADGSQQQALIAAEAATALAGTAGAASGAPQGQRSSGQPSSSTLMEGIADAFGCQVLVLVQNVHFLPFGPSGTAAKSPGLLAAWAAIGGALAVSGFVAEYLQQHAQLAPARVKRVGYCAWGSFGRPPFADLGAAVAARMHKGQTQQQEQEQQKHYQQQQQSFVKTEQQHCDANQQTRTDAERIQQQENLQNALPPPPDDLQSQRPVVGMLKLTPEKGAAVFLELARLLPEYDFVAVAGEPQQLEAQLQQQLGLQLPPNVRLVPPHSNVEQVLSSMWVLLAPSLWQEAFGMVVVDAMLHGIPAVVSSSGGLPEAGLGVAQVVPLQLMHVPVDVATGAPCWQQRQYPAMQELGPWVAAIRAVLGCGREAYEEHSRAARAAALEYVGAAGEAELAGFLGWLVQGGPGS